jgi:hypothetical protein
LGLEVLEYLDEGFQATAEEIVFLPVLQPSVAVAVELVFPATLRAKTVVLAVVEALQMVQPLPLKVLPEPDRPVKGLMEVGDLFCPEPIVALAVAVERANSPQMLLQLCPTSE